MQPTCFHPFFLALLLAPGLLGCANEVTAVLEAEQPFTLYGVVSPQADTQRVRVFAIENVLAPIDATPIDARFRSTDRQTGETRTWTEMLFREADGTVAHAFWAPFRAEYGHTYLLEVERSDGAVSRVEAVVPPASEVLVSEPQVTYPVTLPVRIRGDVPRLLKVAVVYAVDYRYQSPAPDNAPPPDSVVVLPYAAEPERTAEGWAVRIDLSAAFSELIRAIQARSGARVNRAYGVRLDWVRLTFIAAGEDWNPPGGTFDPEVLVQPGTLSNVENGFGFVGAGYRVTKGWRPPDEAVVAAGFQLWDRDSTAVSEP